MTETRATGITRRTALVGAGAVAGAVWVAPSVVSVDAASAATSLPFLAIRLAGGGSNFTAYDAAGNVRRSTDAGDTWSAGAALGFAPQAVAGTSSLLAVSASGTYLRSSDTGLTWVSPTTSPSFTADRMSQDARVVGLGNSYAYSSGVTVHDVFSPPVTPPAGSTGVALLSGVTSGRVIVERSGGNVDVQWSNDSGANWQAAATPPVVAEDPALLAGSPGGSTVFFPIAGWFISASSGNNWAPPTAPPPPGFVPTLLSGSNLRLVAIDATGAVYRSVDSGDNWSAGGAIGFVPTMLAGFSGTDFVVTDGAGQWARSTDSGATWSTPTTPPLA